MVQLSGESFELFYHRVETKLASLRASPRRIVVLRACNRRNSNLRAKGSHALRVVRLNLGSNR